MKRAIAFVGVTLLLSWPPWLAVIASYRGVIATQVPLTPYGAFAPGIHGCRGFCVARQ